MKIVEVADGIDMIRGMKNGFVITRFPNVTGRRPSIGTAVLTMKRKSKHLDVAWYLPGRKRPFAYTTKGTSDLVVCLAEQTERRTPREILPLIAYDRDAKALMQAYIEKGFGDLTLNIR